MGPVNDERRRRLDAIEARDQPASVADLVRAFVEPGLELTSRHGDRGAAVARFIGRVICDPDPRIRQLWRWRRCSGPRCPTAHPREPTVEPASD